MDDVANHTYDRGIADFEVGIEGTYCGMQEPRLTLTSRSKLRKVGEYYWGDIDAGSLRSQKRCCPIALRKFVATFAPWPLITPDSVPILAAFRKFAPSLLEAIGL